jgi:hypothetical protein
MLLEDILNHIDCQPWAEMTGADLVDWYIWYGYGDEPWFGDCFEILKQCW